METADRIGEASVNRLPDRRTSFKGNGAPSFVKERLVGMCAARQLRVEWIACAVTNTLCALKVLRFGGSVSSRGCPESPS